MILRIKYKISIKLYIHAICYNQQIKVQNIQNKELFNQLGIGGGV